MNCPVDMELFIHYTFKHTIKTDEWSILVIKYYMNEYDGKNEWTSIKYKMIKNI